MDLRLVETEKRRDIAVDARIKSCGASVIWLR